jgi:hypothetical protein
MHLIGLEAMTGPTILAFDRGLFASAVVIAIAGAAAAMATVGRGGSAVRLWSGAGLMVLAICGLHFTGMAAITLAPDALVTAPPASLARMGLAREVVGVVILILVAALCPGRGAERDRLLRQQATADLLEPALRRAFRGIRADACRGPAFRCDPGRRDGGGRALQGRLAFRPGRGLLLGKSPG